LIGQYLGDPDLTDPMPIAQETASVRASLGWQVAHEDPPCGAINGDEQITTGCLIRNLWQIFDVDMEADGLLALLRLERLDGCPEPQGIEIAHPMAARAPIQIRRLPIRIEKLARDGQQVIAR